MEERLRGDPGPAGSRFVGADRRERSLQGLWRCQPAARPSRSWRSSAPPREEGMSYGIFYFPEAAYDRSGIELFEREVIPQLA